MADKWERYYAGVPPWESGHPCSQVVNVVKSGRIPPRGAVIELGCGTGATAVFLGQQGFTVTAVDIVAATLDAGKCAALLTTVCAARVDHVPPKFRKLDFFFCLGSGFYYHQVGAAKWRL